MYLPLDVKIKKHVEMLHRKLWITNKSDTGDVRLRVVKKHKR